MAPERAKRVWRDLVANCQVCYICRVGMLGPPATASSSNEFSIAECDVCDGCRRNAAVASEEANKDILALHVPISRGLCQHTRDGSMRYYVAASLVVLWLSRMQTMPNTIDAIE